MPGPNAGKAAAQATRRSRANAYRNRLVAGVTGGFIGGAFTALVRGTGARSVQAGATAVTRTSARSFLARSLPRGKRAIAGTLRSPAEVEVAAVPKVPNLKGGSVEQQNAVTREELGHATWTLLHTMGAQYPDRPTRQQRRAATQLVASLGEVYPCHACAKHWREVLRELGPPKVGSGVELRSWLCRTHNVVNQSIGKPRFDCGAVERRWGSQGGSGAPAALCGSEGGADYCKIPGRN